MTEQKPSLDAWDDFSGEYLKTDIVKAFPVVLVPISIEAEYDKEDKARMAIVVEYNKKKWKLELNKTNQNFIRSLGIAPKAIVGKKLTFEKVQNRNPTTKQPVDSFLLTAIE